MLVYSILYLCGYLLARMRCYPVSGIVLILSGIYLWWKNYEKYRKKIHLKSIFFLSFIGGQGLSAMKLSYLQKPWSLKFWLALYLVTFIFSVSYDYVHTHRKKDSLSEWKKRLVKYERNQGKDVEIRKAKILGTGILFVGSVSLLAFFAEASILGFVPLFVRGVPHAYSEFHISGLHYFTVSASLVPALSILYLQEYLQRIKTKRIWMDFCVLLMAVISLCIPILCVSRFQFMFAVIVALLCFMIKSKDLRIRYMAVGVFIILPVYIVLTIARSHNIEYLNSIFEMRYPFPIYISQPYIYIANNYDNLSLLMETQVTHAHGLKSLFPVFALTGLKFIYPNLVDFPIIVNKTELTTLTIFYDAYYDFGIWGMMILAGVMGSFAAILEKYRDNTENGIFILFYAQIFLYYLLSFFTTWFSNPTTWFYFAINAMIYLIYIGGIYDFKKNATDVT